MKRGLGRRNVLAGLSTGLAAGVASGIARAQAPDASPQISWRLVSSFPKSLDLMYGAAERFAGTIGELTAGRFHIDVAPPTDAISGLQVLDAVKAGTIEACFTAMDYFTGKDPAFALATAMPFGMNARGQYTYATQGAGTDQLNELLVDSNAVAFPAGNTGAQMGGFFKREIKSAADFSGLNIRIGGLAGRVLQKLGAAPQATQRAEVIPALQSGALDGVVWVSPHDDEIFSKDEAAGVQKLAPNYYYPGWWRGGSLIHVAVDKTKFAALPPAYQTAVRIAAADCHADMLARYDAANPAALRRLVVGGIQLRPFPQDVLEAAYKATTDVLTDISGENARFKKHLDAQIAFRNEQYLWWQVGEYTFDNFVIRQRARG